MLTREAAIQGKAEELKQIESVYLKARDYLNSQERIADERKCLSVVADLVNTYRVSGFDPNHAVYLMGRLGQLIADLERPTNVVEEYESLRHSLGELTKDPTRMD